MSQPPGARLDPAPPELLARCPACGGYSSPRFPNRCLDPWHQAPSWRDLLTAAPEPWGDAA